MAAAPADEPERDEPVEEAEQPAEQAATQKATVSVRLVSFEASKKITVIKEVRAMTGEGLKESKEKVEGAPCVVRKAVPRAEAEALAEKLRAAGAEVTLD
uniref:Large ribosomal subunit protein bL12 C-terminal domain-containing protein n=1 Tax=Zooxanthella nutricula TaxID=1333877 RepID=A0A7S2MYH7_9DINO